MRYEDIAEGTCETRLHATIVEDPSASTALEADMEDPTRRVVVEFVSKRDYYDLGGPRSGTSVEGYDLIESASELVHKAREYAKEPVYFGTFYDPVGIVEEGTETVRADAEKPGTLNERWIRLSREYDLLAEKAKGRSLRLLREQVKDFADWLKAQGVI